MVARSRVAAYADVPIARAGHARAGGRLARDRGPMAARRCGERRVIQRASVLLELCAESSTHTDLVRGVVVDDVVLQLRVRDPPARPVGGGVGTRAREVARRAD